MNDTDPKPMYYVIVPITPSSETYELKAYYPRLPGRILHTGSLEDCQTELDKHNFSGENFSDEHTAK